MAERNVTIGPENRITLGRVVWIIAVTAAATMAFAKIQHDISDLATANTMHVQRVESFIRSVEEDSVTVDDLRLYVMRLQHANPPPFVAPEFSKMRGG